MNLLVATVKSGTANLANDAEPNLPVLELVTITVTAVELGTDIERLVTLVLDSPSAAKLGGELRRLGRNVPSPATQLQQHNQKGATK